MMVTNYCSAPLKILHRATTAICARRPPNSNPLIKQSSIVPHQNNTKRSYYHLAVCTTAVPTTSIDPRNVIVDGSSRNSRNGILFSRQATDFHPSHHATHTARKQTRSMVMVTQTLSSENDDDDEKNNNLASDNPATTNNNAEETTSTDEAAIAVTSSCASRIKQLASTRPNPSSVYLRLYVDAGGCSGFQYKFLLLSEDNTLDDDTNGADNDDDDDDDDGDEEDGTIDPSEDVTFLKDGMRVVIDQTSLELLRGSTIDYVQEMIRSSFAVVKNPQSESACGCGSSFAVKNFDSNPALD
mmetsp:Transcript_11239/g.20212  ORF Transcript_11239/g.20212 Transcript_11239/m.20212 type:complete len:299 (-) Transcript_11239:147-1043(-)